MILEAAGGHNVLLSDSNVWTIANHWGGEQPLSESCKPNS